MFIGLRSQFVILLHGHCYLVTVLISSVWGVAGDGAMAPARPCLARLVGQALSLRRQQRRMSERSELRESYDVLSDAQAPISSHRAECEFGRNQQTLRHDANCVPISKPSNNSLTNPTNTKQIFMTYATKRR